MVINGTKPEYYSSGKIIERIVKKYGFYVFNREILASSIIDEELRCFLEIYYIKQFNCNRIIYNTGLNLTNGGEGLSGYKMTEEHKEKMINTMKESYKNGRKPPKAKEVYQYSLETGEYIKTFQNCFLACKEVNVKSPSSIAYCARGECVSTGGFSWSYEKVERMNIDAFKRKRVNQYTLEGVFIKEHLSIYHAGKSVVTSTSAISNCCAGRNKSSKGFIWKFKT